jgi:hypothetical protein
MIAERRSFGRRADPSRSRLMADTAIDPELAKVFLALPIAALSRNEFNGRRANRAMRP